MVERDKADARRAPGPWTAAAILIAMTAMMMAGAATAATPEDAAKLFAAEHWAEAAEAYGALAAAENGNLQYRYRHAVALRRAGNLAAAEEALLAATASGLPAGYADIERTKLALAAGDRETALNALAAAGASVASPALLENDEELSALRGTPAFESAVARARAMAMPCESLPQARQFDFWLGRWRVEDAGGAHAGDNHIRKAELGCVLIENWTSQNGGTGMSINYFDPVSGQWVQNWVGLNLLIDLRGSLVGDAMMLEGTMHNYREGTTSPLRGTWTPLPDGRVRQHFEHTADGGATWTTWFDGYYRKTADKDAGRPAG
jgi:hypothetical protein